MANKLKVVGTKVEQGFIVGIAVTSGESTPLYAVVGDYGSLIYYSDNYGYQVTEIPVEVMQSIIIMDSFEDAVNSCTEPDEGEIAFKCNFDGTVFEYIVDEFGDVRTQDGAPEFLPTVDSYDFDEPIASYLSSMAGEAIVEE